MKSDVNGASMCPVGQEQWEEFRGSWMRDDEPSRIQYDYRHTDRRLFSTIAADLETARRRRDIWLANSCAGPQQLLAARCVPRRERCGGDGDGEHP